MEAQNNELHPQKPQRDILHSASYTKTQLPPKMVARLPKMVAFSADYPPDGAISSVKCCWVEESYTLLYFGGVFPQTCVCACADRRSTTINYAKREGVRSARKSQDLCSRRQSNRITVKKKCMSTTFLQPNSRHHIKSERGLFITF